MKKFIPSLSILLFPYVVVFLLYCIYSGFLMESVFQNNAYFCLLILAIIWIFGLTYAVLTCVISLIKKWDFVELCRVNMLIKVISIPAYIIIYLIGLVCLVTIFTMAISVALMILDSMAIMLSGLIGISAVKRSYDNKAISATEAFFFGILQFAFCADVITSIILYCKSNKKVKLMFN